jgi:Nucleotidyl transferase AbiEii toxin, Type IV TA system
VRPTDVVSLFAPALSAVGVEWMIAGGVAAIVYGEPRLTQDIDIVVALQPRDAGKFSAQFPEADFYCRPTEVIAQEASRESFGHFNVLHLRSDARADVYLAGADPLSRRGLATKRLVELAGITVPIASPEHVILQKLRFRQQGASERHLRDVRAILRVMESAIDILALERDAAALGAAAQWREMADLRD